MVSPKKNGRQHDAPGAEILDKGGDDTADDGGHRQPRSARGAGRTCQQASRPGYCASAPPKHEGSEEPGDLIHRKPNLFAIERADHAEGRAGQGRGYNTEGSEPGEHAMASIGRRRGAAGVSGWRIFVRVSGSSEAQQKSARML